MIVLAVLMDAFMLSSAIVINFFVAYLIHLMPMEGIEKIVIQAIQVLIGAGTVCSAALMVFSDLRSMVKEVIRE